MNSVAVASPVPSLQTTTAPPKSSTSAAAAAAPLRASSAAVHAAMQRSALARQANAQQQQQQQQYHQHNTQFVSRAAQMQALQTAYYAPAVTTRTRRAGSRDRAWTDSTTERDHQPQLHHQHHQQQQPADRPEMAALLRPRVTRAAASPQYQQHHQSHQQQPYQYKQQQQFPTLVHQPHARTRSPAGHHHPQQQTQHRGSLTRTASPSSSSSASASASSSAAAGQRGQRTRASQQPQQQPPPVEWRVAIDPKSKRPYYYHPVTRETTWKKPQELVDREKHERASFFATMEANIRAKLREGNWFRDSLQSRPGDLDDMALAEEDSDDGELSSSTSTSSRSSWSSTTTASVASSSHKRPTSATATATRAAHKARSLPASPEPHQPKASASRGASRQSSNQDDNDDHKEDDDEESSRLLAAAAKPPVLFRTLSSYETPVVGETKKFVNGRMIAVPSPIVERVRLAGMDDRPRASDLEAYTRADVDALLGNASSSSTTTTSNAATAPTNANSTSQDAEAPPPRDIVRQPLRRRSNSTSTIFVRMGTMNKPDQDTTIQCVATVLRAHLMEAQAAPIRVDAKFALFETARDATADAVVPALKDIGAFIKHVFARAQMESECIIMSLIYVERLLKATMGALQLQPRNWRAILFCSMVMASKVWDDLSMCNADFSKIWPELSLREINELELAYLSAVEYNVRVSAVSYAKYYFHLRSMCASMGMLKAFDESAPLNVEGARKMQVLSEEYQERTKLLPAPSRRRSVTITTPSAAGVDARGAALHGGGGGAAGADAAGVGAAKWSPTASLEQLVQMQSRVAGGTSLASMHRLSSSSSSAASRA